MPATPCPTRRHLRHYTFGLLSEEDSVAVEAHVEDCPVCATVLDELDREVDGLIALLREPVPSEFVHGDEQSDTLIVRAGALIDSREIRHAASRATAMVAAPVGGGIELPEGLLAPPETPEEIGRLGGYRVLGVLGRGGMGIVLRAEDPRLKRPVALKVVLPALLDTTGRERFLREAQAAAGLSSDHVVTIHQVGEDRGVPYLAMQLLEGQSLKERLDREGRLPAGEALRIGREIATGLAAAHAQGIVHRDIKPSNVILEAPRGRVKVVDFGLARPLDRDADLTSSGTVSGTPSYLSPEQAMGRRVDCRTDLFSLGTVLYEMTTGTSPFRRGSTAAMVAAVLQENPPPPTEVRPDVPQEVSDLILRLLAKDRDNRLQSAEQVVAAIESIEAGRAPDLPSVAPVRPRRPAWWQSWRPRLILGAMALVSVATVLAVQATRPSATRPAAADAAPDPVQAKLDVLVWNQDDATRRGLRLEERGALPLRPGDQVRVEIDLRRPMYVYLMLIDTEGHAHPVYPWTPGDWSARPPRERPVRRVSLPETVDEGWPVSGPPGMETLILLARHEPLPREFDLREQFMGLPRQMWQDPRQIIRFESGRIVEHPADGREVPRGLGLDTPAQIQDPVLRTQARLYERLRGHFATIEAISFANELSE